MANCSDAHGTYEFLLPDANDNTVKALALFITLMQKRLGNCEYNTYLTDCDDDYDSNMEYVKQNIKTTSNKGSKDSFSLITPFFGTGRWSYKTNTDNMANWMELRSNNVIVNEENEKLIKLLGSTKITIICEYTDFDPGMEILYKGEVTRLLDKTLMLPIIEDIETSLDCTYENLVNTEMITENDTYIDIRDIKLVKDTIIDVGSYEIGEISESMGIREEEIISKLIDTLDIKAIKDIGWLCLGDTAINTDCIPEIIYDLAEKYLSYKPA